MSCLVSVLLVIFFIVFDFQDEVNNDAEPACRELPCLRQLKFTCLLAGLQRIESRIFRQTLIKEVVIPL